MGRLPVRGCPLLVSVVVISALSLGLVKWSVVTGNLMEQEKQNILEWRNELRRVPDAANMCLMMWDSELETLAQNWASKCKNSKNPNPTILSTGLPAGENRIVDLSDSYTENGTVISWDNQKFYYIYSINFCATGKNCDDYKQLVWATSNKIGCGVEFCPEVEGFNTSNVYMIVCNYSPAGNIVGLQPYNRGKNCSQCPRTRPQCDDGLCTDLQTTTPTTPTSTPTTTSTTASTTTPTTAPTTTPTTTSTTTPTSTPTTTPITTPASSSVTVLPNPIVMFLISCSLVFKLL